MGTDMADQCMHFFIVRGSANLVESAIETLRNSYEYENIKCVLIDKDFGEINALQKYYPCAKINLCLFHVSRAVKRACARFSLSTQQKQAVHDTFMCQVAASSKEKYDEIKEQIADALSPEDLRYFADCWWKCPEMWATYLNHDICNLGIKTTNHKG